jgi:hypothetical protein
VDLKGLLLYGVRMVADLPKHPSINELLERITRLEETVSTLSSHLERSVKVSGDFDKLLMNHCKHLDRTCGDFAERIQNIEFTVFPNLARDVVDLHNIIGAGEEKADNSLDRREVIFPPKRSPE